LAAEVGAVSADRMIATPKKDYALLARKGTIGVVPPERPDLLAAGCPKEPPSLTTTVSPKWLRLPRVCSS
jgi:hypothetical protein